MNDTNHTNDDRARDDFTREKEERNFLIEAFGFRGNQA